MSQKKIAQNTTMLLLLNIAKMVFPFVTLPYLTRILTTDAFGMVTYVKAVMSYMQIIIDFGFILSATKNIVEQRDDKQKLGCVVGDTLLAKFFLVLIAGVILIILMLFLPLLRRNILFTVLSYLVSALTIFLMDYLFRGLEVMYIITIRFVLMKGVSTLLTFVFVKGDNDLLFIPLLDIFGSLIAVALVMLEIRRMGIHIHFTGVKRAWKYIKESAVYFASNVASTSFNMLNTLIIGTLLSTTEVAYWGVCIQIVCAVQALYTPISDGIYPEMIKNKNINFVKKILKIFIPIIAVGCVLAFVMTRIGLFIVGGEKYLEATTTFRCLIPVMFFGFPAIILGWPTLGAINKTKETTISTVTAVLFQIVGICILFALNAFTLLNAAILRSITEFVMLTIRFSYVQKYKASFERI